MPLVIHRKGEFQLQSNQNEMIFIPIFTGPTTTTDILINLFIVSVIAVFHGAQEVIFSPTQPLVFPMETWAGILHNPFRYGSGIHGFAHPALFVQ